MAQSMEMLRPRLGGHCCEGLRCHIHSTNFGIERESFLAPDQRTDRSLQSPNLLAIKAFELESRYLRLILLVSIHLS